MYGRITVSTRDGYVWCRISTPEKSYRPPVFGVNLRRSSCGGPRERDALQLIETHAMEKTRATSSLISSKMQTTQAKEASDTLRRLHVHAIQPRR